MNPPKTAPDALRYAHRLSSEGYSLSVEAGALNRTDEGSLSPEDKQKFNDEVVSWCNARDELIEVLRGLTEWA